jgi:hypothetical protein
MICRVRG